MSPTCCKLSRLHIIKISNGTAVIWAIFQFFIHKSIQNTVPATTCHHRRLTVTFCLVTYATLSFLPPNSQSWYLIQTHSLPCLDRDPKPQGAAAPLTCTPVNTSSSIDPNYQSPAASALLIKMIPVGKFRPSHAPPPSPPPYAPFMLLIPSVRFSHVT